MLHWDWPQTWSLESREALRQALETSLREAMAGSEGKLVRGLVHVELPEIGGTPPQVMLTGIRELSLEHTALMVRVCYDGECSLKLRGLQVNVDTIEANSTPSSDLNLAMPFYCPLEMTLSEIRIDGVASIEIFQDIVDGTNRAAPPLARPESTMGVTPSGSPSLSSLASLPRVPRGGPPSTFSPAPSSAGRGSAAAGLPSSGYGALLGAGGRRAMRPPQTIMRGSTVMTPSKLLYPRTVAASLAGAVTTGRSGAGSSGSSPVTNQKRYSLADLATKRAFVKRRYVKVQLFGDPIKHYKIESNLDVVPGAGKKVEEHIQEKLNGVVERLMTEGITIDLSP